MGHSLWHVSCGAAVRVRCVTACVPLSARRAWLPQQDAGPMGWSARVAAIVKQGYASESGHCLAASEGAGAAAAAAGTSACAGAAGDAAGAEGM